MNRLEQSEFHASEGMSGDSCLERPNARDPLPEAELVRCACALGVLYRVDELARIFDFYILRSPTLKAGEASPFGLRSLADCGWRGSPEHGRLEKALKKASGIGEFKIVGKRGGSSSEEALRGF